MVRGEHLRPSARDKFEDAVHLFHRGWSIPKIAKRFQWSCDVVRREIAKTTLPGRALRVDDTVDVQQRGGEQ